VGDRKEDPVSIEDGEGQATSHRISNNDMDLDTKILIGEEDLDILMEDRIELMGESKHSGELDEVEKKISTLKNKLNALRELRDFRKTREQASTIVSKRSPQKPKSTSWKVPTNLPMFRGSKGMEDPLELVEQFE